MAPRPFLKLGIEELEQKFEQESADAKFCKLLQEELGHRTTQRAKRLKKRLDAVVQVTPKPPKNSPLPVAPAPASKTVSASTASVFSSKEKSVPFTDDHLWELPVRHPDQAGNRHPDTFPRDYTGRRKGVTRSLQIKWEFT